MLIPTYDARYSSENEIIVFSSTMVARGLVWHCRCDRVVYHGRGHTHKRHSDAQVGERTS